MANNEEARIRAKARQKGYKQDEIEVIQAVEPVSLRSTEGTLRVCAYCRVSTDNVEQASSFELQRIYYEEYIEKHPNWINAGIYSDEGISGTSLRKRDGFNKMIRDCKEGKIDLIVTKAVARFSRNVVDCIDTIRQLKRLNPPVRVFFETENIDTADSSSDVMLNLLSIFAQEESHTKSEIMNWSIESRFSRGNFLTPELFGYTVDIDKEDRYTIVEDEAEIVRLVYSMYVTGYSPADICDVMTRLGYKSNKKGEVKWNPGVVNNMITNERRAGMIIARKTYTPDYTTHKTVKNVNQRNKYKLLAHHDPIVPLDMYYRALDIQKARKYRNFTEIPRLRYINDGLLKGFVPVAVNYPSFTIENYKFASSFAYEKDEEGNIIFPKIKSIDSRKVSAFNLSGFEKVNSQIIGTTTASPMCWFKINQMYFNRACIDKMNDSRYIKLLFEPNEMLLAILECDSSDPFAIKWMSEKNDRIVPVTKTSGGFSRILYKEMEWDESYRYRMVGVRRQNNGKTVVLFDLKDSEALYWEEIENDEEEKKLKLISLLDEYYINHFGNDYYQDIYSMRLYLTEQLKKWNLNTEEIEIESDDTEWLAEAKELVKKHLIKLTEGTYE